MTLKIGNTLIIGSSKGSGGGSGYNYLLDTIAPVTSRAAFSLRELSSTYTGACIRVRRSSDGTEQDIGFDSYHKVDTNALLTFCGSGSGYITKIYDQSGNGRDRIQTIQNRQPRIVNSGVVETYKGKPAINFFQSSSCLQHDVSTILAPNQTNVSLSMVYSNQQVGDSVLLWAGSSQYAYASTNGDSSSAFSQISVGGNYINNSLTTISTRGQSYSALYSPSNYISHQLFNLFTDNSWENRVNWGGYGLLGGFVFLGYYAEEIWYNGNTSSSFSTVFSNQNNYYGL